MYYRSIRNLLFSGLMVAAMSLVAPQVTEANDRYWNNYWDWYGNDYSRYYNRRHQGYRYSNRDYYGDYRYRRPRNQYNRYPRYNRRHSFRGSHNSLQLGPLHLDWR